MKLPYDLSSIETCIFSLSIEISKHEIKITLAPSMCLSMNFSQCIIDNLQKIFLAKFIINRKTEGLFINKMQKNPY